MKNAKKSLAAVLAVLTIFLSICAAFTVSAASLKEGRFNLVTKKAYYKISVSGEGYITLTGKSSKSNSAGYSYASLSCRLLNSKKESATLYSSGSSIYTYSSNQTTESRKIPVSKGTYYIYVDSVSSSYGGTNYVKYTFTSVKQPTNYCVAKAATLKRSAKTTIYQTQQYNFDRWYKITLSKNQFVTISFTTSNVSSLNLYDANGKKVGTEYSNNSYKSKTKLAAGTYYICYSALSEFASTHYTVMYWK